MVTNWSFHILIKVLTIYSDINPHTFAVLIDVTKHGDAYSLESELYIIVDVFTTIRCSSIEQGDNDSLQVNILKDGMCKYNNYARQSL